MVKCHSKRSVSRGVAWRDGSGLRLSSRASWRMRLTVGDLVLKPGVRGVRGEDGSEGERAGIGPEAIWERERSLLVTVVEERGISYKEERGISCKGERPKDRLFTCIGPMRSGSSSY